MAQNLGKIYQALPKKDTDHNTGSINTVQETDIEQTKKPTLNLAKSRDKDSKYRFERYTPQRASKSLATHPLADNPSQVASQRYLPSKVFAQKCSTELQLILEKVEIDYHQDIRSLFIGENSERYTDLVIHIGESFQRSLHKCILASRTHKFYSAIKLFRKPDDSHIIISQFQECEKSQDNVSEEKLSPEELIAKQLKEKQQIEALEHIECIVPRDLISAELVLNFLRRVYSKQDLIDEENQLSRELINWLKVNKPELIQTNTNKVSKIQPDYRESFRTIQPDIEQLSLGDQTSSATTPDLSSTTDSALGRSTSKMANKDGSIDDGSQTASLTRTETFELISKNDNSSSVGSPAPVSTCLPEYDENRKRSVNDPESPEDYAPTTRTGLKPKKFTTPEGVKSKLRNKPNDAANLSNDSTSSSKPMIGSPFNRSGSIGKSSLVTNRSSGSTTDASPSPKTSIAKPKTSTPATKSINKPIVIARAHPISMERSQSPASVAAAKSKPKNFIAANKKLVSQMEKKISSAVNNQGDQTTNASTSVGAYESENETSDTSFLAIEPLTTDNLAAQLDRFTLASCSKLAEALSRMFIGEILTDSIILVNAGNKQISAHKCVLAARSAYLNDIISKQSLPTTTTSESLTTKHLQPLKIDLGEFSYPVVYFSIMHIYSGIVKVPDDLELEELAKLTNTLHVGTLRQVCIHNLKMNYCHYFHKPCSVCSIGVLKTLPLAWRYDYTELYSKCLQWIGSHFAQIFCLEEFSTLKPHDLIEECYRATLSQLTPDNVIQKTIECQKLLKSLPRVKWTESIICLVGRQLEDFCHYVADNYEKILQSDSFLALGKSCWECEVLEENLLAAMNHLKPDSGCKTLIQLDKIECSIEPLGGFLTNEDDTIGKNVSESFVSLITKMRKYCERYLLKEAAAVVHCPSWKQMHPSLQKRIKDQALLSTDFDEPTKTLVSKPKLQSMARQQGSRLSPTSPQPRSSGTVSPASKPSSDLTGRLKSPSATYLPPPKNKPAAARHVKALK